MDNSCTVKHCRGSMQVLIIDPCAFSAETLGYFLDHHLSFSTEIWSSYEVSQRVANRLSSDVVVINVHFDQVLKAIDTCAQVSQIEEPPPILLLASSSLIENTELLISGLENGASAVLPVDTFSVSKINETFSNLANNCLLVNALQIKQALIRRKVESVDHQGAYQDSLTLRELEVGSLLAKGYTTVQIADYLQISSRTVQSHVNHIISKLGAKTRSEAVALLYDCKIL